MNNASSSYEVVRETWLTRKPNPSALFATAASTAALCLGSLIYLLDLFGIGKKMSASWTAVHENGELWRLWTTVFAHSDMGHLAANTFLFFILGFFLYGYFGFGVFPLAALIFGGIINYIALSTYDPETVLVGASGVVYWMGGVWLVLYFLLSRQKNLYQRWLRTLGVAILIFMPSEAFEMRVSYRTHFIGFAVGILFGIGYFLIHRKKFRAAEIKATIIEEPEEEPGPEDDPPSALHNS